MEHAEMLAISSVAVSKEGGISVFPPPNELSQSSH